MDMLIVLKTTIQKILRRERQRQKEKGKGEEN
jgi:hypothetical protein